MAKLAGNPLSERERQVLNLVAQGLTSKTIATEVGLGPRTVDIYRLRCVIKLGATNTVNAVAIGICRGLIDPPELFATTDAGGQPETAAPEVSVAT